MKKTKEDALITKKQIIEKALELFLQQGFSITTLDEIAQRVNVTRGAIYWHFKDKLDIVRKLIETEHQNLSQLLVNIFNEDLNPLEKIQKVIEQIVLNFYDSQSFRNFIELTWFKIEYTQLSNLQTTKAELTAYFISNFKHLIIEAQKVEIIKTEVNPTDVSITITNMINGMYRMYFILPNELSNKEKAMQAFNSYLNLIKN